MMYTGYDFFRFLGLPLDHPLGFIAAGLMTLWIVLTALRLAYCVLGRVLGVYDSDYYRFLVLPVWRLFWRAKIALGEWFDHTFRRGSGGTARPAGALMTMSFLYRPGCFLYGRLRILGIPAFQPVGEKGERHAVLIAGTGGGKTTFAITAAAKHLGNVFLVDPKGQMTRVLRRRLGAGGPGIVGADRRFLWLDFFRLVQKECGLSACFNVLDELTHAARRHGKASVVHYAKKIAEGLLVHNNERDKYWIGAGRVILTGIILWVYHTEPPARRHLLRVFELFTVGDEDPTRPQKKDGRPSDPFDWLLFQMQRCAAFPSAVNQAVKTAARTDLIATSHHQAAQLKKKLRGGIDESLPVGTIIRNLQEHAERMRADLGDMGNR